MEWNHSKIESLYRCIGAELTAVKKRFEEAITPCYEHTSELVEHLLRMKGKSLRPALLLLVAKSLGDTRGEHIDLAVVVELLHNATLIHDDILDEAETRRNLPCLNRIWGTGTSVIFGDWLFSRALTLCAGTGNLQAVKILAETVETMCSGELAQFVRENDTTITESEYLDMISQKTASLFGAACHLGTLYANADPQTAQKLVSFGVNFGLAFQIVDDCLDILGSEASLGKSVWRDLAKGRLTLPFIKLLGMMELPTRTKLASEIFDVVKEERRKYLLTLLSDSKAMEYALSVARKYYKSARAEFVSAGLNGEAAGQLLHLVEFMHDRTFGICKVDV